MPDLTNDVRDALPKIPEKETLKRYRDRVHTAAKFRSDEGLDETWERAIDFYRGKQFEGASKEDQIVVNLSFANINVIGPSIAINYPKITVSARDPQHFVHAVRAEAVLNYWWRHFDFLEGLRDSVQDFLVMGAGWLKVGWRYEEADQPRDQEAVQEDYMKLVQQANDAAHERPEVASELPTDEDIGALVPQTETVPVEDRPYVERVDPFDMYWDAEATRLSDAKWVAQKVVRPLEEVKRDKRYNATARKRLEADTTSVKAWSRDDKQDIHRKQDVDRVTLWEFYDLRSGQVSIFSDQGDAFLVAPQDFAYPYGHPYVMLRNYNVPNRFAPIGEIEMIEPLQRELNKTRSQLATYRRRHRRKILARRVPLGQEGWSALQSDQDNQLVPVNDDGRLFDDIVKPIVFPSMDATLYNYTDVMEKDIDRVSGVSDYMRGSVPETRRTATEAGIIQGAVEARASDKVARVEHTVREVSERLLQLAQTYLEGDQVVRISGVPPASPQQATGDPAAAPDVFAQGAAELAPGISRFGNTVWLEFTREDIQGEFDFEVEAGSTQPRNEVFRKQQGVELLQTLAPYIGPIVDPRKIVTHVLRDSFGISDPDSYLAVMDDSKPVADRETIVQNMNYKDLPPAARKQLLEDAGLPSEGAEIDVEAAAMESAAKVAAAVTPSPVSPSN